MTTFPGRPDHTDFWLLAQAILDLDAQADAGQSGSGIIGRYIDPESAGYMALQRATRAITSSAGSLTLTVSAAWLDGFLTGMAVQHLKASAASLDEELSGEPRSCPDRGCGD